MTPAPKRQWMSLPERRAQLLACAVSAFARRGLGRAVHADVAKEAGVSVATVFAYYPTRDDLVDAVVAEVDRHMIGIHDALGGDKPAREAMLDLARAFASAADTHPDYVHVWLDWSTSIRHRVWTRWLDFQRRSIRRIRAAIRESQRRGLVPSWVDADAAARIYNGSAHTVALMKFAGVTRKEMNRLLGHLVDSALRVQGESRGAVRRDGTPRPRRTAANRARAAGRARPARTFCHARVRPRRGSIR